MASVICTAHSSLPSVQGVISSIWRRGERQEADRSLYFERDRCNGVVEVEKNGLQNNMAFNSLNRGGKGGLAMMNDPGERAVLVQTKQTYAELNKAFPGQASLGDGSSPAFGENFILDGFSGKDVCVGDVFQSSGSTLKLQVSSPRYACFRVDKKHPVPNLPTGKMGTVRHFVNCTGRGGILFRVLETGFASDGDVLYLSERMHPKWSLEYLSQITFPLASASIVSPMWNGTDAELHELCHMKELARWEWKDLLQELEEKGTVGINQAALSGDRTLQNVGIRLTGAHECSLCNQKFDTDKGLQLHCKFIHDANHH